MKNRIAKKLAAAALAALMTISLTSTAPVWAADAKTMTIGVTSFADTLEPTEQYFSWVISRYGVGQGLTRFDEEGNMVPCLATEWTNSEDGKTWTFTIRDGVKFSNGNDLTPEQKYDISERLGGIDLKTYVHKLKSCTQDAFIEACKKDKDFLLQVLMLMVRMSSSI